MSAPIKSSRSKNRRSEQTPNRPTTPPPAKREFLSPFVFWIAAGAVIVAILAAYNPSLNYPFILDDNRFIGDRRVQLPGQVFGYFTNAAWAQFAGGPNSFYRPLFVLWVRVNYILNETSPWGWHFASVLKHVAVAVLLGLLVWKLLRDRMAVLIAVTLFALHPAHTESVAWVSVPDPLMSAAVLGSILLYLKYRESAPSEPRPSGSDHRAPSVWLAASAILYLAALLVKETAIVAFLILFALALRSNRALRDMPLFVAMTVVYFAVRLHALAGRLVASTQHLPWTPVVLPGRRRSGSIPKCSSGLSSYGRLAIPAGQTHFLSMVSSFLPWAWVALLCCWRADCTGPGKRRSVMLCCWERCCWYCRSCPL